MLVAPFTVRLLLSRRDWETGVLSPLMFTFQRHGSLVLKKYISWVVKLAREWEKIDSASKGAEKEFIITSFLKLNV